MADDRYDYYSNHPENRPGRDRDRDAYLDNRTGIGAQGRGYRADNEPDRSYAERNFGSRDYFRDQSNQGSESRSFRPDRDYGIDRGYRGYSQDHGDRYSRGREDNYRNTYSASGEPYYPEDLGGGAYNAYPSYSYGGGYEMPYQYEGEPRRPQSARGDGYRNDQHDRGFWNRTGDTVASWFGDDEARRRHEADMRTRGHQGRGPKAYKRSDSRIHDDVNDRLTDDPWVDATHIEVKVQDTEVTLSGTVNSRDDRRHAERIAEHVSGVTHVQNNLRVDDKKASNANAASASAAEDGINTTLDKQAQGRH